VRDPTGQAELSLDDPQLFADPNPVPAIAELKAGGLTRVPHTKLSDGYTRNRDDWVAPS
jgi:hypothetical protein